MAKITKYKLKSKFPEELEFEVKRIGRIIQETTLIQEVDEDGNILSPRGTRGEPAKNSYEEGITAVSLPSRTPAEVTILEVQEDATIPAQINADSQPEIESDRPKAINLTAHLEAGQDARTGAAKNNDSPVIDQPIPVPAPQEVTWADNTTTTLPIK